MPGPTLGPGGQAGNMLDKFLPSQGLLSSGEISEPSKGYNIREKNAFEKQKHLLSLGQRRKMYTEGEDREPEKLFLTQGTFESHFHHV